MSRPNVIRGRIEEHGEPLGTVDWGWVRRRAREIAVTNGRAPNEFNEADLEQARAEAAAQHAGTDAPEEELPLHPDGPPGSRGHAAPTRQPTDEQTVTEDLVAEGLDEADHDRMVAGNKASRHRDEHFDDQLPSNE